MKQAHTSASEMSRSITGFEYFSNKDFRIGPMNSHDCIYFVIHMDAARREMKAASCFDIIEFNTQLDTEQLVVGDPPRLPSAAELGLVRRVNPDLAITITENYEKSLERWLKREAAVASRSATKRSFKMSIG
jgi:hypothetical protein